MADKKRLGDVIHYPGMDEEKTDGPSMFSRLQDYLFGSPKRDEAPAAQPSTSGGPAIIPEKAKQFQKSFFGK